MILLEEHVLRLRKPTVSEIVDCRLVANHGRSSDWGISRVWCKEPTSNTSTSIDTLIWWVYFFILESNLGDGGVSCWPLSDKHCLIMVLDYDWLGLGDCYGQVKLHSQNWSRRALELMARNFSATLYSISSQLSRFITITMSWCYSPLVTSSIQSWLCWENYKN